jgi:hypothetical protein
MSNQAVPKPDKDHSSEVNKLLPEAEALAKVPNSRLKLVCNGTDVFTFRLTCKGLSRTLQRSRNKPDRLG